MYISTCTCRYNKPNNMGRCMCKSRHVWRQEAKSNPQGPETIVRHNIIIIR